MSRKPSLLNAIIVHRIKKTIIFKENLAYSKFLLYLCSRNRKLWIVSPPVSKLSHSLRPNYRPPRHDQPTNKTMADIEKISTQQLDTPFSSDEYKELLLQAVAVIESARCRLARQVAATSN